jgi:predicted HTH transcriptional regulator
MRVGKVCDMQTQRTVDGAPTPLWSESTLVTAPVVPQRSARRATARRASNRRATARQRKDDLEGRIIEYLKDRPQSTTGDIAKGLNASRGTIAAGLSNLVRASKITQDHAVR